MRADLPTGTVTFLFTDVEGSTKLLHELGADAYAEALAEHRRAIREACAAEGGVEVDTQGDAFFFAFPTAPGALAAAAAMTEALAARPIRVRSGLHTGTPLLAEEGYIGDDVHRAARIAAAGHGGQVLVSATTASLVEIELTDLGEHRFKDLSAPERVYQLGDGAFPPLRSLYRTNLPVPATTFLGREQELAEVVELLQDGARLLTLTGPGGTGKTRLAIHAAAEAAESFPDGIWWVPMASLRDANLLTSSVAQALGIEEQPGRELAESVAASLTGKQTLLMLDNAEHLMPEVAAKVAELRDIAGPTVVVTSRERLQLQGEHVYSVPSLEPEDGVELFLARARSLDSPAKESEAVTELCRRLDNLPLALELAAARTVVFSPEQLVERLSGRLDLLKAGRDADPRQQTLRATIEWSYDLLEPEEQRLFRALSVFAGSCDYEAAESVCDADPDTLQSLLDKSLIRRREERGQTRYWMLESIRELAVERLGRRGRGCRASTTARTSTTWRSPARRTSRRMSRGPQTPRPRHPRARQPARDSRRGPSSPARLRARARARRRARELLGDEPARRRVRVGDGVPGAGRRRGSHAGSRALRVRGGMANGIGRLDVSEQSWEQALAIARDLGDDRAVAILLHRFSNTAMRRDDPGRVRELAEESLAGHRLSGGWPKGESQALGSLAWVARAEGHPERALELLRESCALARRGRLPLVAFGHARQRRRGVDGGRKDRRRSRKRRSGTRRCRTR